MKTLKVSDETFEKIKDQLKEGEVKPIKEMKDLVGQVYTFWCARWIYHGKVKSVNTEYIVLENASVVFETGDYGNSEASDIQSLPNDFQVMIQSIEGFTKMNW